MPLADAHRPQCFLHEPSALNLLFWRRLYEAYEETRTIRYYWQHDCKVRPQIDGEDASSNACQFFAGSVACVNGAFQARKKLTKKLPNKLSKKLTNTCLI